MSKPEYRTEGLLFVPDQAVKSRHGKVSKRNPDVPTTITARSEAKSTKPRFLSNGLYAKSREGALTQFDYEKYFALSKHLRDTSEQMREMRAYIFNGMKKKWEIEYGCHDSKIVPVQKNGKVQERLIVR